MCTGILVPTSGTVRVAGLDPVAQRRELARRIGVVFGQRSQLWWDLPLGDSFELLHRIHRTGASEHKSRLAGLLAMLEVAALVDVPVRQLSLGQRMRGELVAALLHGPELLFLDEPTIGLDVVSKHAVREGLLALRRDHGVTIVLTTHDLGDVRRLCDRVTVMDQGRIALDTTLDGLMARSGARRRVVATFDDNAAPLVSSFEGAELISTEGPRAVFEVDLERTSMADALARLSSVARLADLVVEERDIEAVVRELYERR
jgi:ABC-2 type transport system ATP-binding protein